MNDYMLLLSGTANEGVNLSEEEQKAEMDKYLQWLQELQTKGIMKGGNPLAGIGKKITNTNGIISDGPFSETKEAIGGYFIVVANNLEEAGELAKTCPHVLQGGSIEVRPIASI